MAWVPFQERERGQKGVKKESRKGKGSLKKGVKPGKLNIQLNEQRVRKGSQKGVRKGSSPES
jgi:hypothetical protein